MIEVAERSGWPLPSQPLAAEILRVSVARGEVSHAWAFLGPPGTGQEAAARLLVAALHCPDTEDGSPCGVCETCDRAHRGAHPSYTEFFPTGAAHRVTDVRDLWLHDASLTPAEGHRRVIRIAEAERMNEPAANAFLKVLEEPPASTIWILEVSDPLDLPDTILSRCRVVRFQGLGPEALAAEAEGLGIAAGDRPLALRAAMGSALRLRRYIDGADDVRRHREIPRRLGEEGPGFALTAARQLDEEIKRRTALYKQQMKTERDELDVLYGEALPRGLAKQMDERQARREREIRTAVLTEALDDLLSWYRDCLVVAFGGGPDDVIHADDIAGLEADVLALAPAQLIQAADRILLAREHLELNVGTGLALEALLLDLSTAFFAGSIKG